MYKGRQCNVLQIIKGFTVGIKKAGGVCEIILNLHGRALLYDLFFKNLQFLYLNIYIIIASMSHVSVLYCLQLFMYEC